MQLDRIGQQAEEILRQNWTGIHTRPAPRLYPHQWSWDSGFIAIGYAHFDQQRACSELTSLFKGQWANGMLPHIVFHAPSRDYYPDETVWRSDLAKSAPKGVLTSGLTQPPIHATASLHIYDNAADKGTAVEILKVLYPGLLSFHRFLHEVRDPEDSGLATCVHPWETGIDNSPKWDDLLARIEVVAPEAIPRRDLSFVAADQRPSADAYAKFLHLVKLFRRLRYDQDRILKETPFLVYDVLFNSVLHRADQDLLRIAGLLGKPTLEIERWIEESQKGFERILWHPGDECYHSFDLRTGNSIRVKTASCALPLLAKVPGPARALEIQNHLSTVCPFHQKHRCVAIPTYDRGQPGYQATNYWRGPVWVNVNWMIWRGLLSYGLEDLARKIRFNLLRLVDHVGFWEYYYPSELRGLGSERFSWTAALVIDLLRSSRSEGTSKDRQR